jgi:uncharacterized protein with von Willebrand factor type A (vWA) domain
MSYLSHFIDFLYELRESGLNPYLSNIVELMKILPKIDITNLWLLRESIKAIILKDRKDEPLFNYIFNQYFLSFSKKSEKKESKAIGIGGLKDPQLLNEFKQEMLENEQTQQKREELEDRLVKDEIEKDLKRIKKGKKESKEKSKVKSMKDLIEEQEEIFEKEMEEKEKIDSQRISKKQTESKEEEKAHGGEEYHKEIKEGKKNLENSVNEQKRNLSQIEKGKSEDIKKQLKKSLNAISDQLNKQKQINDQNEQRLRDFTHKAKEMFKQLKEREEKDLLTSDLEEMDKDGLKQLQNKQLEMEKLKKQLKDLENQTDKKHGNYLRKKLKSEISESKNRTLKELANPQMVIPQFKENLRRILEEGGKYSMKELTSRLMEMDDALLNNEDFQQLLDYNLKEFNKAILDEKEEYMKDLLEKRKKQKSESVEMGHLFSEEFTNLSREDLDKIKKNIKSFLRRIDLKKRQVFKKSKKKKNLDIKATSRNLMKKKYEFIYKTPKFSSIKRLVFLIDVSGSIINYVPSILLIIREFRDHIKKIKYFFFVDYSIDVTEYIKRMNERELLQLDNKYMWKEFNSYNHSYSNIGKGIESFYREYEKDLRKDDFVLIFSDARNNYKKETGSEELYELEKRLDHIYWLNPELKKNWNTGDSIMRDYSRILPTHSISSFEQFFNFLTKIIQKRIKRADNYLG